MKLLHTALILLIGFISFTTYAAPRWIASQSIYEVNIRQFSEQGTFRAVEQALPHIQAMGAKVIWLMPIHPIGVMYRKGTLGSPYSVRDYLEVNPEFGTKSDFRALVSKAHQLGMYVILDWVANHTAWDHAWTQTHPDYYNHDSEGRFFPPVPGWDDVIDLNYDNPALAEEMIRSMEYWVREFDVDGFRCDVASMVPSSFWAKVRPRLERIKPVFMLAESESRDLFHNGFDALYGSDLYRTFTEIAGQRKNAEDAWRAFEAQRTKTSGGLFMQFSSNHDENAWGGDLYERLGDASAVFSVLTATLPGIPLIYGGQEAALNKRLAFFDKDPIIWRNHWMANMYARLFALKSSNAALQAGAEEGGIRRIRTGVDTQVLAFVRERGDQKVVVMTNLSSWPVSFRLQDLPLRSRMRDVLIDQDVEVSADIAFHLVPWGFRVFSMDSAKRRHSSQPHSNP